MESNRVVLTTDYISMSIGSVGYDLEMSGKFFLTGTRAYGPVTNDSDLDIVMYKTDALKLLQCLKDHGYPCQQSEDCGDTGSFKCVLFDRQPPINIIIVNDRAEWYMWEHATNRMKTLHPILDRDSRINTFHEFQKEGLDIYLSTDSVEWYKQRAANGIVYSPKNVTAKSVGFTGFVDEDIMPPTNYVDYDDDVPF